MRTAHYSLPIFTTLLLTALSLPADASPYSWKGAYGGVFGGGDWVLSQPLTSTVELPKGLTFGGLFGVNLTDKWFITGAEIDLSAPGVTDWTSCEDTTESCFDRNSLDFQASLRARGGFALGNVLLYGTAGYAVSDITADSAVNSTAPTVFHSGWTYGGGVEIGLTPRTRFAVEYRDVLYRDAITPFNPRQIGPVHGQEVTLRLNFHP